MGLLSSTGPEALTNLSAELNTSGAVPMFHILGLTPDASTLDQAVGEPVLFELVKGAAIFTVYFQTRLPRSLQ